MDVVRASALTRVTAFFDNPETRVPFIIRNFSGAPTASDGSCSFHVCSAFVARGEGWTPDTNITLAEAYRVERESSKYAIPN
jgi:hypothetical protein